MEKTNINSMYVSRVTIGDIRRRVRPGRLVRVKWTDTGATDCIVVEKESEGKVTSNTEFKGFFLDDKTISRFSADQIIDIGDKISVDTGL
jgi:hypothetical protein